MQFHLGMHQSSRTGTRPTGHLVMTGTQSGLAHQSLEGYPWVLKSYIGRVPLGPQVLYWEGTSRPSSLIL